MAEGVILYRITHQTKYGYAEPVSLCHNLTHLTPRGTDWQLVRSSWLDVSPTPAVTVNRRDYFGNPAVFFTIQDPHRELEVTARHDIEVLRRYPPDPHSTPAWEEVVEQLKTNTQADWLEASQFTYDSPFITNGDDLAEYALPSFPQGRPILDAVTDLTARIFREFAYDPRATTLATPLREVLAKRRGVCQDFAHLQIGCLRSLGLAARYVSGYLRTSPPPGQKRLVGADASHAWVSVYVPGSGWVDLDPTNNLLVNDHHILVAWGRDYDDVSPIKGVILGGGRHSMGVSVDVEPIDEAGNPA